MSSYDTDYVLWTQEQADLLRRMQRAVGDFVDRPTENAIDWTNLAEEIESLGKRDQRELRSRIRAVLQRLFYLQAWPADERHRGWQQTIRTQREGIELLLRDSPSLQTQAAAIITAEMEEVRPVVGVLLAELDAEPRVDLATLDFTADQVLNDWFPE